MRQKNMYTGFEEIFGPRARQLHSAPTAAKTIGDGANLQHAFDCSLAPTFTNPTPNSTRTIDLAAFASFMVMARYNPPLPAPQIKSLWPPNFFSGG